MRTLAAAVAMLILGACAPTSSGSGADGGQGADANRGPDAAADADGDLIPDEVEGAGDGRDTDQDGMPDYLDEDSDADGLPDLEEGLGDDDGDGMPNYVDPRNDGPARAITLTAISTTFNSPIGIDYHEPTDSVVVSVNYPTGLPLGFERIEADGAHEGFSTFSGLTDEVKIGTARSGNLGGFIAGDLFVGNGLDGQIVRITDGGATILNPWVSLDGEGNGLMRGSLYVDRTGVFGGDLIASTTGGEVWRITSAGVATRLADVDVHLEGLVVVPNFPARFGPLAGKIIAGAEAVHLLYAFAADGTFETYTLGVDIEDIDVVMPDENFFGVNFGTSRILGVPAVELEWLRGDVLLTQELVTSGSGLFRLHWDGVTVSAQPIPLSAASFVPGQWEHVTTAPAGIGEVPPID
jgi:hypothetical protein